MASWKSSARSTSGKAASVISVRASKHPRMWVHVWYRRCGSAYRAKTCSSKLAGHSNERERAKSRGDMQPYGEDATHKLVIQPI